MHITAVQHERKPLLDKKEAAAAAAAAAALAANNSSGGCNDITGLGAFGTQNRSGSNASNTKPYSRNDFISSPTGSNLGGLSNLFPVGISFAELTSTLAQRGSESYSISLP